MSRQPTIIDAINNPKLSGSLPRFKKLQTWTAWLVVLKAIFGLAMTAVSSSSNATPDAQRRLAMDSRKLISPGGVNGYRSHFGHVRKVPRHDACDIVASSRKHRYLLPLTPEMKTLTEKMRKPYIKRATSDTSDTPGVHPERAGQHGPWRSRVLDSMKVLGTAVVWWNNLTLDWDL